MSGSDQIVLEKQALRRRFLSMRKAVSMESVEQRSFQICDHIEKRIKNSKNILFYMPVNREVDLLPLSLKLFQKGFNILFPRVIDDENMEAAILHDPEFDFIRGRYNIPEPKTEVFKEDIDLILVPGVVFDEKGYRIGYGKGYYDRFLAKYPHSLTVGVAFRFQIIPILPKLVHDIALNAIVSEDGYKKLK